MKFVAIRNTFDGAITICHPKSHKAIINHTVREIKNILSFCGDTNYEIVINKLDENSDDYRFYAKCINK